MWMNSVDNETLHKETACYLSLPVPTPFTTTQNLTICTLANFDKIIDLPSPKKKTLKHRDALFDLFHTTI